MSCDHSVEILRSRFIAEIEAAISSIGDSPESYASRSDYFSISNGGTFLFRLSFQGRRLILPSDDHVLTSETLEDLLDQLDQIMIIAGFGGLDEALIASTKSFVWTLSN